MNFHVQACTQRSRTHAENQDRAVVGDTVLDATREVVRTSLRGPATVAVLDGLGGHPAGEVASSLAAEVLAAAEPPRDPIAATQLLERADLALHEAMREDPSRERMGTTAALMVLGEQGTLTANVGDSSVLRMTGDGLVEVTSSDRGPGSRILQCLGDRPDHEIAPHVHRGGLEVGDRLVLASDGLTDVVPSAAIEDVLRREPDRAAELLLASVTRAGTPDDVTIIVVDVTADGGDPPGA